jgi:Rab GDP dissociation inhibitor
MEEQYDAIVLGTGLVECVLSGLLSVSGMKVLHMDENNYYGGECASLNLEQLYTKFNKGAPPADLGKGHLYNVDLCPKLLMADGILVKILRNTVAKRYSMDFCVIEGSYVVRDGKIHKIPSTDKEALSSNLMGMFEKRRCAKFFGWVQDYNEAKPETHKIGKFEVQPHKTPMHLIFKEFGLEPKTIEFVGHAAALYTTDDYLNEPAHQTLKRVQLYTDSMSVYGSSPYVYPLYGLGDIPQAFARLSAVFGGTYMLNTPVSSIELDESGKFVGVKSGDQIAKAPLVVGSPTYFIQKGLVKTAGSVIRCICLLQHPIPNIAEKAKSCQIIIPQSELKRRNDVYVICVSYVHKVCPEPYYIALVSTTVETANPEQEIEAGLALLGPIKEKFVSVTPLYTPVGDGINNRCFVSDSMDPTTHFESACENILELYQKITGKPYDYDQEIKEPSQE